MGSDRSDDRPAAVPYATGDAKATQRERLAEALRINLKRRKAQGRARRGAGADQGLPPADPDQG